jgi:hypothetical protein
MKKNSEKKKKEQEVRMEVKVKLPRCNEIITIIVYAINTDASKAEVSKMLQERLYQVEIMSIEEVKVPKDTKVSKNQRNLPRPDNFD